MHLSTLTLLAAAGLVSAHFELVYPTWRGDSFLPPASQYSFPCGNIETTTASSNNRTLWPLDGGSLVIEFHHPWTYFAVNLGLGSNTSTFNISLSPMLFNETGNGTVCVPKWHVPADLGLKDGDEASLQVITIGDSGTALYNCADIKFTTDATLLSGDQCQNSTNVDIYPLVQQDADDDHDHDDSDSGSGSKTTVTVTAGAAGASSTSTSGAVKGLARPMEVLGALGPWGVAGAAILACGVGL